MTPNTFPKLSIVLLLLATSALTVMAGTLVGPSLPALNSQFDNVQLVSLLLTLPALAVVVTAPFVGKLTHKLGLKPLFIFSLFGYGLAGSTGLWLDSLPALLIGRFALGMSIAVIMTLSATLVSNLSSGQGREKLIAYQSVAMNMGGVVFVGFGGYLADLHWRLPFSLYLLAIALTVIAVFTVPTTEKQARQKKVTVSRQQWFEVLPFYIVGFMMMVLFYMIPVMYPFVVTELLDARPTQIGLSLALFSIVAAFSSMLLPKIAGKISEYQVMAFAALAFAIGHLFIALAGTWVGMAVGGCVVGVGFGIILPALNKGIAARSEPANRPQLMGGFVTAFFLGQFISPIAGRLFTTSDTQSAFIAGSVVALTLALLLLFLPRIVHRQQHLLTRAS
ncbi:MFS transporter [Photobacterium makurazakiensis]|uniref:MFS transporter n=1 Tax=Photobacterium makurazakiensis TaxID=2910234 RepID=UPI003D102F6F